jgi:NADPH:quinone reductase-like Zn-dependent oxidoreductase
MKTGSTIATYSSTQNPNPKIPFLKMMYMDLTLRLVIVYAMPEEAKNDAIKDINNKLSNNHLVHRVAKSYDLNDIVKGHELIESNKVRGCVILNIS